ncbi:MAG: PilZ domain-containing protein [Phycisphaerae bacterium]|nr:PilZ domain-containing protein [Phycisphaerae bacterium]
MRCFSFISARRLKLSGFCLKTVATWRKINPDFFSLDFISIDDDGLWREEAKMASATRERRRHRRHDLVCPITLFGWGGKVLAKSQITDISDSGARLTVPVDVLHRLEKTVNVAFSVPGQATSNNQLEGFASNARIVRHEPMVDEDLAGVALQFARPMQLGLQA